MYWFSISNKLRLSDINPLTPNDDYSGHTAPLTSKRCILYIYSTNTEYFKHGIYSPFFLQNAVCFIILTYLVPVLFTFYIQSVLKLKKNNPGAKRLSSKNRTFSEWPMSSDLKRTANSSSERLAAGSLTPWPNNNNNTIDSTLKLTI